MLFRNPKYVEILLILQYLLHEQVVHHSKQPKSTDCNFSKWNCRFFLLQLAITNYRAKQFYSDTTRHQSAKWKRPQAPVSGRSLPSMLAPTVIQPLSLIRRIHLSMGPQAM